MVAPQAPHYQFLIFQGEFKFKIETEDPVAPLHIIAFHDGV